MIENIKRAIWLEENWNNPKFSKEEKLALFQERRNLKIVLADLSERERLIIELLVSHSLPNDITVRIGGVSSDLDGKYWNIGVTSVGYKK